MQLEERVSNPTNPYAIEVSPEGYELGLPPHGEDLSMHSLAADPAPDAAEMNEGEPGGPAAPFHSGLFNVSLTVDGIEATQGTQFYKSQLPAGQAEPDNSVPLIDTKHLAIRVYPDLAVRPWPIGSSVDGVVWFKRIDIADRYRRAFRLNGEIPGRRATLIDRADSNHTLNFRISDLYTKGRIVVYARVWTTVLGRTTMSPWFGRVFTFTAVPKVRVRVHGVHYQRGAIDKPAPTLSDFLATGVYLRKAYPMSRFEIVSYDVINFGGDLTDTSGGGCGVGWNALWNQLRTLYFATGQDANHYALMEPGIPTGYGGCGGGFVGASFVGGGSIMAQELGHGLGRGHAPGCGAGGPDPNYPSYGSYGSASIGEYGMDYATGAVYSPAASNDFMGYCANPWVSPYTYRGVINGINSQPTPARASAITGAAGGGHLEDLRNSEEHLYLGFKVFCDGNVELTSGVTLAGPPAIQHGKTTHYAVELQNDDGTILYAKQLTLEEAHQDLNHASTDYFDSFPMLSGATRLVFKCHHGEGPQVVEIPEGPPEVKLRALPRSKAKVRSGELELKWTATDAYQSDREITFMVRYSNNDGDTWQPVAVGLTQSSLTVDLDALPGGDKCRFQLLASNILRTGHDESGPFEVARTPRKASITPIASSGAVSGDLELAGAAYSPDGSSSDDELEWNSSIDGYLGTGDYLVANGLTPGEHVITLVSPDGNDATTRAQYRVSVPPRG